MSAPSNRDATSENPSARPGGAPARTGPAPAAATLTDRLLVWPQYALPQHALSRAVLGATRVTARPFKNFLIGHFLRHFAVNMREAAEPDPFTYVSFNAFFTRSLAEGARPVDAAAHALCCPADGTLSQLGRIDDGELMQAKGMRYSATDLLGGDEAAARRFARGSFATIYLAPSNYHRVHMPAAGRLTGMRHVPGRLFSVNDRTSRVVPRLFARNERTVSLFETEHGAMAVVLVGAFFVGCIEHVWSGVVTPRLAASQPRAARPQTSGLELAAGEEMGRFNMGSTVIVLHASSGVRWEGSLEPGKPVRMGQRLARLETD